MAEPLVVGEALLPLVLEPLAPPEVVDPFAPEVEEPLAPEVAEPFAPEVVEPLLLPVVEAPLEPLVVGPVAVFDAVEVPEPLVVVDDEAGVTLFAAASVTVSLQEFDCVFP